MKRSQQARRGLSMAIVLAALAAVALLATAVTRTIVNETRAARGRELQSQAIWLAESGASRAAAQLQSAADYRGETWRIAADELGGGRGALVVIEVRPPGSGGRPHHVRIEARYGDDAMHGVMHVKEFSWAPAREEP